MRYGILLMLLYCQAASAKDCVVLLHGLGRTSYSMSSLEEELAQSGYLTVNENYPSREKNIDQLTLVVGDGITQCKNLGAQTVHFVTHSLGGILVRRYFQNHVVPEAKRVVMLAPPNHGSEVVDKFKDKWWFKSFTGLAGQELGTGATGIAGQLKPVPLEIGIIAGTESLDPWFAGTIAEPNDGKVSVASTKLAEMKDFITVAHSHTFISSAKIVTNQVKSFLAQGKFIHDL